MRGDSFQTMILDILLLLSVPKIAIATEAICYDSQTGQAKCCHDYKNISGTCEACIGSWGMNCQNNCKFGFFGHGCRERCNCNPQEICDRKYGCIDNNTTMTSIKNTDSDVFRVNLLPIVGVLVLPISCLLLYKGCQRLQKSQKHHQAQDETFLERTDGQQLNDQEFAYSECGPSRLDTLNGELVNGCNYAFSRQYPGYYDRARFKSLPSKCHGKEEYRLTRSRSVEAEVHGYDCMGVDDLINPYSETQRGFQKKSDSQSTYGYSSLATASSTPYPTCRNHSSSEKKIKFNQNDDDSSAIYSTARPSSSVKHDTRREDTCLFSND